MEIYTINLKGKVAESVVAVEAGVQHSVHPFKFLTKNEKAVVVKAEAEAYK